MPPRRQESSARSVGRPGSASIASATRVRHYPGPGCELLSVDGLRARGGGVNGPGRPLRGPSARDATGARAAVGAVLAAALAGLVGEAGTEPRARHQLLPL